MHSVRSGFVLSAVILCSIVLPVQAQSLAPPAKTSPLPLAPVTAVFGPAGLGFPYGTFGAMINYRFSMTDGIRFHDSKAGNSIKRTSNIALLKMRYGFWPGFDIRSETPLYNIHVRNRSERKSTNEGWLGDTTILVHRTIASQSDGDFMNIALDAGGIAPTATTSTDSNDFLGNQAWGLMAGVGASWFTGYHRIDVEANFASFNEGTHEYRKPDRARINAAYAYAYSPLLDFGLESNFEWNGESEYYDKEQDDSFTEWFAGPKISYRLPEMQAFIGTSLTLPVYRYYEVSTPSDSFRFELKFSKLF